MPVSRLLGGLKPYTLPPSNFKNMSQTGSGPRASAGSTFATPDGSWPRFVEQLADRSEAEDDCREHMHLREFDRPLWDPVLLVEMTRADIDIALFKLPATPCAQVLDIHSDNTVRVWSTLTFAELFHQRDRAQQVDRFLDSLRSCASTISSRLLILNNDIVDIWALADDSWHFSLYLRPAFAATMNLLTAHVLGIEYDVEFYDVLP